MRAGWLQMVGAKLADMYTWLQASRAYVHHVARQADAGALSHLPFQRGGWLPSDAITGSVELGSCDDGEGWCIAGGGALLVVVCCVMLLGWLLLFVMPICAGRCHC
jgi:alkylation response protein AidB-like acyl-CoA dehydrogenase